MTTTTTTTATTMALTADSDVPVLSGRGLRFVLVNELMSRPTSVVTVAELVRALAEQGYRIPGRASKTISDALRWELRRGRLTRLGRGRYQYQRAPRSTARRIRVFADRCHTWIVAKRRGEQPLPTPPNQRALPWLPRSRPDDPPWTNLGWLWTV